MDTRPAVRVTGLVKHFGGTVALRGADLTLRPGSVHALLGGNGSGKSTTIKILAGVHRGDAGTIEVGDGRWDVGEYTARHGRDHGLRFVHQDLGLFDDLSIAENFALDAGYPAGPGRRVRWPALRRRVAQVLEHYEIHADPRRPVGSLRPADRAMVAIARALQDREGQDARELILILDEPTASLGEHESALLLDAVRRRADQGQTVMIVSHRMPEVLAVADDFTVFRDGRAVSTLVDAAPTENELIDLMTGTTLARTMDQTHQAAIEHAGPAGTAGAEVLRVENLHGGPLRGASLTVRRGEVVGVAGLVGSGRTTLLTSVFGDRRPAAGGIWLDGRPLRAPSPDDAMRAGIAYVPEARAEAAFADLTVRDNLSATVVGTYWRPWGMARARERADAARLIDRHSIKVPSQEAAFASLSGGNQQKAILARWLRRSPRLMLLDEPTHGVDVMSRSDIYQTIRATADAGCAVVVASSDFIELAALCDRVLVLKAGRVAAEISGPELTADRLTAVTQSSANQEALP